MVPGDGRFETKDIQADWVGLAGETRLIGTTVTASSAMRKHWWNITNETCGAGLVFQTGRLQELRPDPTFLLGIEPPVKLEPMFRDPMINTTLYRLVHDDEAATSVEYAVMLVLIAGVCIAAIQLVGFNIRDIWADNQDGVTSALGDLP